MKFFGMGMPELIIILLVILVIFGPKNLPKLGSALGKAVKGVREGVDSVTTELDSAKEAAENAAKGKDKEAKPAETPITATAVVEDAPEVPVQDAAAPAGVIFCSQCGTPIEADAKFCKKCGSANS